MKSRAFTVLKQVWNGACHPSQVCFGRCPSGSCRSGRRPFFVSENNGNKFSPRVNLQTVCGILRLVYRFQALLRSLHSLELRTGRPFPVSKYGWFTNLLVDLYQLISPINKSLRFSLIHQLCPDGVTQVYASFHIGSIDKRNNHHLDCKPTVIASYALVFHFINALCDLNGLFKDLLDIAVIISRFIYICLYRG